MGMKQYTYCGPMLFVKPITSTRTRRCLTHGDKEGLYCNICGKDIVYRANPFDYDENIWMECGETWQIENDFDNILLIPSEHEEFPEEGIINPDFALDLTDFQSDYKEELDKLKANALLEVHWVIVNYWA